MLTLTKKNFIDLIQTHVPLEEHGAISSGYCPFCFDDEETFLAYPDEQKWHCFGCQQKGNIYQFIEETENLSAENAEQYISCFINQTSDTDNVQTKANDCLESEIGAAEPELEVPEAEVKLPETEIESSEPEIAVSEPEILISEPETIISEIHSHEDVKKLLDSYHTCSGCQGIAIIHHGDSKLIGSSIDDFDSKDIHALNSFVVSTLKLTTDILGDFDKESSQLIFRMNLTIKETQKKLIWVPMLSKEKHKYNLLMLLDNNVSEKMLLIKLKNNLKQIDI